MPLTRLKAQRLGSLIGAAVHERPYRDNAEALARRVRHEDGAGRVLAALDRLG
ncbi:hypothetical protein A8924_7031 [Saccharopolyspora erythraea NRRL 2338]|uniref:Uncharacterized protein n=2 Tax=Saccharopolyspora erythraea TaxID=1836 RepID=A4FP69_SACEN|nr:hypothetical protein [Saccharopolyspora erythraea]EQD84784.1 hypothetical protein N599_18275 [Saccharopolyspora erythraea D]PFG99486.1 hypothetical protein A8924_7031 [Saccharopolyspora erythraea NRRL 2338]QRK89390.1 hypothetical protein JQX30_33420 [Saccharopolyspora erythraea]CAM05844.1 hypothetical protein SACE_6678 [Saccharopolyspora erythraea NRRL 2338]